MRRKFYLNGEWHFMPDFEDRSPYEIINECKWESESIRVPSSWKWKINHPTGYEPYDMFKYPEHWNNANSGVLGKAFEVHAEACERVFLIFKGVLQNWQVYINDKKVLESQEAFLPVEVDITDFVNMGTANFLKVWCGPFKTIDTPLGKKQVGLTGSWFAQDSMGIWQDVIIEYRNEKFLKDPVVRTSFREKTLHAEINTPGAAAETVQFSILDAGKEIKSFEAKPHKTGDDLAIYSGSVKWEDAVLWMPETPHLYTLRANLIIEGKVVDTVDTIFGFREVWCKSNEFYLNRIRVNLRGDSWHYQGFVYQTREYALNWYKLCKETGINFIRLHAMPYPEIFLEAADEVGMMIIDESAIYGSNKKMQADNTEFIRNCKFHLEELVKRDRNHPSVIMWSMQNEMRWVDGRDGFKLEMKKLIAAMKALDPTRPISFDGDNRLVDPEDMEVVSMHYNIDGTVASWDKSKPLAFGEHGKWHYISPQVASSLVGGRAYESIDSCLLNLGLEEELFIEYARKEDVTAVCPFNTGYYMMKPMPAEDMELHWDSLEGPGVKPKVIRKYSMTINNGLLKSYPEYIPNASYEPILRAFRPVAIFADEYDTSFFEGIDIKRTFSIYNDSYSEADVSVEFTLTASSGETLKHGCESFYQLPGERKCLELEFRLPKVNTMATGLTYETLNLELKLSHNEKEMHVLTRQYKIYPLENTWKGKTNKKVLYIGKKPDYDILKDFTGAALLESIQDIRSLKDAHIVILGKNYRGSLRDAQPVLNEFVSEGGFLLVMEQDREAPGELVLSGRKHPNALITEQDHPVFNGLYDEDFANWCTENMNIPESYRPVLNAFERPMNGDLRVLLECGEGDFGWGGLLWAAMLEYRIGKGRVILQQLDITSKFNELPQARLLLGNILTYASEQETVTVGKTGILTYKDGKAYEFLKQLGLDFEVLTSDSDLNLYQFIAAEPETIGFDNVCKFKEFVRNGGKLLILPLSLETVNGVEQVLENKIYIESNPIYQFKPVKHPITEGITPFDCYHFENVTYSPANKCNSVIAEFSINSNGLKELLTNISTPWEDMFVKNLAGESIKQSTIQFAADRPVEKACYCGVVDLGKGQIMLCQLKTDKENSKLCRVYTRLLANMGASIKTNLLSYIKEEKDFGFGSFMALPYEPHNDFTTEEAYFSDKNYVLNNLGEGVYGWMKRVEKRNGCISIENSAGKIFFLTLFIQSEINRNPLKRESGELPDSSIVPDLLLCTNAGVRLFVNGNKVFESLEVDNPTEFRIDDIMLDKGLNRLAAVFFGGTEDISFNGCFINKFGDFISDLKYMMTID